MTACNILAERNALAELLQESGARWDEYIRDCMLEEIEPQVTYEMFFANYILPNSVIVLPCKVGDTVYSYKNFYRKEGGLSPYQITNITITQNKKGVWTKKYRAMQVVNGKTIDRQLNFSFDDIGKTVFQSFEEAEKALAERNAK